MGKDLRGKELGEGLQEVRQWLADATYIDQHSDLDKPTDMIVDAWYEYRIGIKKQTVRPNTVRNYTERYEHNIKDVIGKKLLTEVKPVHSQTIFSNINKAFLKENIEI